MMIRVITGIVCAAAAYLFLAPSSVAATCEAVPGNAVSWWRGEFNARDSQGPNHGALMNGVTFAPGIVGCGFAFDGVDDMVVVNSTGVFKGQSEATIEAWIRPQGAHSNDDGFGGQIFGENTGSADWTRFGLFSLNDGRIIGFGRTGETGSSMSVTTTATTPIGEWSHVVATWKTGDGLRVYLNGAEAAFLDDALVIGPP